MIEWIGLFFSLCMGFYFVYLVRAAFFFHGIRQPQPPTFESLPSVTVLVPARNEAGTIGKCVRAILAQEYPAEKLQLIVVNDHSEDRTVEEALEAAGKDLRFRLVNLGVSPGMAFKKAAIACGIEESSGEWIVTTDADCVMGKAWLRNLGGCFGEGVGMVSGPVGLTGSSIFQKFQALEFMGLIAVGAGSIAAGQPNMCNGANLAYRRDAFEEVNGFKGIDQIASGDDELLMHKIGSETSWEVAFAKSREAIVWTEALRSWAMFKSQRQRWVSKSTHYKKKSITVTLVLSYLAILGIPVLGIGGLFWPDLWFWFVLVFGLKILGEAAILFGAASFFDKFGLLKWLFPEQLAHIVYVLWVGLAGNKSHYTWKGRQVK